MSTKSLGKNLEKQQQSNILPSERIAEKSHVTGMKEESPTMVSSQGTSQKVMVPCQNGIISNGASRSTE